MTFTSKKIKELSLSSDVVVDITSGTVNNISVGNLLTDGTLIATLSVDDKTYEFKAPTSGTGDTKFTRDIKSAYDIGNYKVDPTKGYANIPTKDKNIENIIQMILEKDLNPTVTQPSLKLTSDEMISYEAGTLLESIRYECSFDAGKYSYGPDTGITYSDPAVTLSSIKYGSDLSICNEMVSSFANVGTLLDSDEYLLSAQVKHTEGAIPKTSQGNDNESLKITEGYKSAIKYLKCFRYSFYGIFDNTTDEINSALIRQLSTQHKTTETLTNVELDVTDAMRVIIAIPQAYPTGAVNKTYAVCDKPYLASVKDYNASYENITNSFTKYTIPVNDYSGNKPINYSVYVLDSADKRKKNTFIITT